MFNRPCDAARSEVRSNDRYLLPRSTNIRRVFVDNSTTPVTFWVGNGTTAPRSSNSSRSTNVASASGRHCRSSTCPPEGGRYLNFCAHMGAGSHVMTEMHLERRRGVASASLGQTSGALQMSSEIKIKVNERFVAGTPVRIHLCCMFSQTNWSCRARDSVAVWHNAVLCSVS